ncbi:MAG TPA: hypothetical protein VNJ70_14255 [Thermoanaerobaculia bacterium]|nr:hypothetical protein [Thermoanaerobaculia bacterium]
MARRKGATGGHFSICYHAVHTSGRRGFLKALNFHVAASIPGSFADILKAFFDSYVFERDLLAECGNRRLSRIINLLDHGEVDIPEAGVLGRVPYLIFEPAEGDIREFQARLNDFDLAWVFRVLKHATNGIEQLHASHTTHQDLKMSNVLTMQNGREMKLGDLGRAERRGVTGPTSALGIPGALGYAPPEQLYGAFDYSWGLRRAADIYHLGSLAVQLFTGHNLTSLLLMQLEPQFRPDAWSDDFKSVMPFIREAHATVLHVCGEEVKRHCDEPAMVNELLRAVQEMTDPDPSLRGHPRDRAASTSSYAVRRYVSLFNKLSAQAESRALRAGAQIAQTG